MFTDSFKCNDVIINFSNVKRVYYDLPANFSFIGDSLVSHFQNSGTDQNNIEHIYFGPYFNTANITNMSNMFYGCNRLRKLDLSSFDTSNVTDMSYMFYECELLNELWVSTKFKMNGITSGEKVSLMFAYVDMLENCLKLYNFPNSMRSCIQSYGSAMWVSGTSATFGTESEYYMYLYTD